VFFGPFGAFFGGWNDVFRYLEDLYEACIAKEGGQAHLRDIMHDKLASEAEAKGDDADTAKAKVE